jgi:uncharacterized DUF497 family protein
MNFLNDIIGFQWDSGNETKNMDKHGVSKEDIERVFFNHPLFLYPDLKHSTDEERLNAYGHANNGRLLHITFCIREKRIRTISARDMKKTERRFYEKAIKKAASLSI